MGQQGVVHPAQLARLPSCSCTGSCNNAHGSHNHAEAAVMAEAVLEALHLLQLGRGLPRSAQLLFIMGCDPARLNVPYAAPGKARPCAGS